MSELSYNKTCDSCGLSPKDVTILFYVFEQNNNLNGGVKK